MTTEVYNHPTVALPGTQFGGAKLTVREHTARPGAVVVTAYKRDGESTYFAADADDRPRLALAMLGERVDERIGYMDVEGAANDPRVADDYLAFFAYRSLAALQLRKERAAEAAVAQARVDEERESAIEELTQRVTSTLGATFTSASIVALHDAGIRAS